MRITAEVRPRMLIGMAEMSFGKGIPEVGLRREEGNFRSRLSFFYSGKLFGDNMLTLSYDSQRPINRTAGRDRLFNSIRMTACIRFSAIHRRALKPHRPIRSSTRASIANGRI